MMSAVPWMCLATCVVGLWDLGRAYRVRSTRPSSGTLYVPGGLLVASALALFALSLQRYSAPIPKGWSEGYSTDLATRPEERHPCPTEDLVCATVSPSARAVGTYEVRPSDARWDGTTDTLMSFAAVTLRSMPAIGAPQLGRVDTIEMGHTTVGRYQLTSIGARAQVYVLPFGAAHLSVQFVAASEDFDRLLPAVDEAVRATHGPRDVTLVPFLLVGLIVLTKGTSIALAKRSLTRSDSSTHT